jgi:ATP-dependent protease ClpP protease subunit
MARNNRNNLNSQIHETHEYSLLVDSREIFLNKHKDSEDHVDYLAASTFLKNARILESQNSKPIIVHQFGFGGCFDSCKLIYDAIKSCTSPVIIIMWGAAYSANSIIPQAADLRIIAPNTNFMLHEGSLSMDHTAKVVRAWVENSEKGRDWMINVYADKCLSGQFFKDRQSDLDDVKKFIRNQLKSKEDWILNAREAVQYGFADAVLFDEGYENIEVIRQIYANN